MKRSNYFQKGESTGFLDALWIHFALTVATIILPAIILLGSMIFARSSIDSGFLTAGLFLVLSPLFLAGLVVSAYNLHWVLGARKFKTHLRLRLYALFLVLMPTLMFILGAIYVVAKIFSSPI